MLNKENIFLTIADSIMKSVDMPSLITNCPSPAAARKTVQKYFANCLASSSERVNLSVSESGIAEATLDLFLLHYANETEDIENTLEEVETKHTPRSIVVTNLNRFSGIDLDE